MRTAGVFIALLLCSPLRLAAQRPADSLTAVVGHQPTLVDGSCQPPAYPDSLRAAGVEGRVVVQFVVDTSGNAEAGSARVLSSTNPAFEGPARAAVMTCHYHPGTIRDRPVRVRVEQAVNFTLSARRPS